MVGEKLAEKLPERPLSERLGNRFDDRSSSFRNKQGDRVKKMTPNLPRRNFGNGMGIGAVGAGIAELVEAYIPLQSDAEIAGAKKVQGGVVYTVNVDTPFKNVAEAKGVMESGSGFTSFITDQMEISDVEVLRTRPLRDTYQMKVKVMD